MARVVIIVDMLRGFLEEKYPLFLGPGSRRIIPNVRHLLETEVKRGSHILFLADSHRPDDEEFKMFPPHCVVGTMETEVIPELSPFQGEIIPKTRYSGFYNTKLGERLGDLKPETVVVCGVCTDICVMHTVADARSRDFTVEVPVDCVASFDLQAHQCALEHMEKVLGARLTWATAIRPPKPEFKPSAGVLFGETADVGLPHGLEIIKGVGLNPVATTEVKASRAGVLCGMDQVRALLEKALPEEKAEVWALEDGEEFQKGEVVLRIVAAYQSYAVYETAYLGFLAQNSGWATAARECVMAARSIPVINFSARNCYPTLVAFMEYASVIGGCKGCSTMAGAKLAGLESISVLSESLFLAVGSPENVSSALKQQALSQERLILPVGIWGNPAEESLFLAKALGGKLRAIKLAVANHGNLTPQMVKEVRASLNNGGFKEVEIYLTGDLTPEGIKLFLDNGAPVDYFGVEGYISKASPISFEAEVCQIDGKPVARPGHPVGPTLNRRLRRVL